MSAVAAVTLFVSLGVGTLPASAAAPAAGSSSGDKPAVPGATAARGQLTGASSAKLADALKSASSGRHAVFVQFAGTGAADASAAVAGQGKAHQKATAKAKRQALKAQSAAVVSTAKAKDRQVRQLWATTNSVPGVAITADKAAIDALAARADVVKISPLVPKTISNSSAAQLTKVLNTWQNTGNTGKGVTVGIIDTGIDYTHADFGGPGTVAAWDAAHADPAGAWTSTAKVVGGYDFVGDDYNADPAAADYQPIPHPDANPLDCNEHGTHVAGTVAGYGVNGDGSTYTGNYTSLTSSTLNAMKIGPGMAPQAALYALKVFGCTGSTDEVIPAMDWALDPNGDGDFSDHLDIINMSLGSDFAPADDPENAVVDSLARNGVLPVIAMGNAGDLTDAGGAPGNAVRSLAVASTVDALQLRDGLKVNAPVDVAGIAAGQFSVAYDWANKAPVTGDVVAIPGSNADGCTTLSAADAAKVAGKVAWLEWDDNDSTRRCGSAGRAANVAAAGAVGSIFTSSLNVFAAGITGSAVIPVIQLPKAGTDKLRPALDAGTLNVTFDGSLKATIQDRTTSIQDLVSSFSSRGTHGSIGVVKPDVAAPGDTIGSAGMGTGNDILVISGTSMATPHVAGISALVKAVHPSWTTEQVKAAVMNTAGHDVYTGEDQTGYRYGPARVGAGRVDALAAVNTQLLAYSTTTSGAVSASFGVVPVDTTKVSVTKTQKIKVQNTGTRAADVVLSYEGIVNQPGVAYTVSPRVARVPARGSVTATVTMRITAKSLRHTIDPSMDTTQIGVPREYLSDASGRILISQVGKADLRVPVYGAAKPVSTTTAKDGKIGRNPAIILKGKGVAQGAGSTAFTSLASVLQLGAKSGKLPACSDDVTENCVPFGSQRAGDLKAVGAGASPSGTGYADGWLWFGIESFANWATVGQTVIPYVDIDVDGDGEPDYEVQVMAYPDTDVYLAALFDLATGDNIDLEPINFNFGDTDTNIFDNNVLTIPVWPAMIGVDDTDESFPITYEVHTHSGYTGADIDSTGPIAFDVADPGVSTDEPLYQDQGNVGIPYTLGSSTAKKGTTALVLHLHGADGKRAELVKLAGAKTTTVTAPIKRR
jgi:subtilisin family serine protease